MDRYIGVINSTRAALFFSVASTRPATYRISVIGYLFFIRNRGTSFSHLITDTNSDLLELSIRCPAVGVAAAAEHEFRIVFLDVPKRQLHQSEPQVLPGSLLVSYLFFLSHVTAAVLCDARDPVTAVWFNKFMLVSHKRNLRHGEQETVV